MSYNLFFTRKFTQAPLNQSRLDFRDGCDDAKGDGDDDDDRSKGNPELIMTGGHPLWRACLQVTVDLININNKKL